VAQGEGPEFKPQYHENKQQTNKNRMGENLCQLLIQQGINIQNI
jgi:hypothetical protein